MVRRVAWAPSLPRASSAFRAIDSKQIYLDGNFEIEFGRKMIHKDEGSHRALLATQGD
jgi:hypothetical protein